MKIYKRENYLSKIRGFYHDDIIKVVTGIRRAGKSFILLSIIEELKENKVSEKNIIYINLDKKGYKNIKNDYELENIIDEYITDKNKKYIFIDEIQNVKNFEPVINAYREEGHSIFITGSNSYLLSGELVTKLTGRYIEFEIMPLSFFEYIEMKKFYKYEIKTLNEEFNEYMREGGFPKLLEIKNVDDKITYIRDLLEQIINKDIRNKNKIRNNQIFTVLKNFIVNNFGASISPQSICNELNKIGYKIKLATVCKYIEYLENAKIIYKCERFDLKSKKAIRNNCKYYLATPAIYFAFNTDVRINYGQVIENIVYTYFKSKRYNISIGKIGNFECDFILRRDWDKYYYVQVATTILESKETEDREYRSLESIRDNFPKYVLTLDSLLQKRNGIIHENVIEFMANNKDL